MNVNENNESKIIKKENIENDINNNNYSVPFKNQLKFNIKRNLLSLLSNKNQNITLFLIVLIPFLVFLLLESPKKEETMEDLWNIKIDEIYIYTNDKNYLINSTYYKKNEKKIKIKWENK